MDTSVGVFETLWQTTMARLPFVVWAIVALFIGWIIARIVSGAIGRLVRRFVSDPQVGLTEREEGYRIDRVTEKVVYWVIMVFVLVQFFEILGVTAVTGPFLSVAHEFALAVPNLVKTILILLAAWALATILKGLTVRFLGSDVVARTLVRLKVIDEGEERSQLVNTASSIVYYLVLAMFLPAVFSALRVEGLQGPLEQVVAQVLAFLPRLAAAAVTLFIGYVAARIVQRIATHFLASVGLDRLPERVGMGELFRNTPLSGVLGTLAFIFVFIPLVISALDSLGVQAISDPAIAMLTIVLAMVPNIIVALLLLAAGIALARWVGQLTTTLLENLKVSALLVRWGLLRDEESGPTVHSVLGNVVTGLIVLLISIEVLDILHLNELSAVLWGILLYIPHVVLAVAILAIGFAVGGFVQRMLRGALEQTTYPTWLSGVAKYAIFILASVMALEQLGVARAIVVNAFSILLGSLGLGVAIALGLGGKDTVQKWLDARVRIERSSEQETGSGD